jgi:lipopolysaccharide assembly protein A
VQFLVWTLRLLIVAVLVWFAVKNADPVTIKGLPDQAWQAPLVFVLLVAFVGGVVIGLLAWLPTVVRQKREVSRLKKSLAQAQIPPAARPAADPAHVDVHGI